MPTTQPGFVSLAPYILLACVAGAVNIANAWKQLSYDCRFLVFFRPAAAFSFYIWSIVQFVVPAVCAWVLLAFGTRPSIDIQLIVKVIGFGILFVALMNATTEVAGLEIDHVRRFYRAVIGYAKNGIAARETARTAVFWQSCKADWAAVPSLENGFAFLRDYIEQDISLAPEVKRATLDGIDKVAAVPDRGLQVVQLIGLLAVRRRDLPTILQHFGYSEQVISALMI